MSEIQHLAYFAPIAQGFWTWTDQGTVVAWREGETIAYRAEVAQVLAALPDRAPPPIDAIVLALAATRENWSEVGEERVLAVLGRLGVSERSAEAPLALEVLDALRSLPADQRSGRPRTTHLARLLARVPGEKFGASTAHALSASLTRGLAIAEEDSLLEELRRRRLEPARPRLRLALRSLARALEGVRQACSEAVARLADATGLEALPQAAEIDSPRDRARRLISELEDDESLGELARSARQLLAVVRWPRPLRPKESLPDGGFSDLANRGSPDRLLLTELAQDGLVLATRVALREALYLRREVPPSSSEGVCAILVDTGLRTWGLPRVFATATALALVATADTRDEVASFAATKTGLRELDLLSAEGLARHLSVLETMACPTRALEAFLAWCGKHGTRERLVVTTDEVSEDPAFAAALAESNDEVLVASVDADGMYQVERRASSGGRSVLGSARLDLDSVFRAPSVAEGLRDDADSGAPLAHRVSRFPLRVDARSDLVTSSERGDVVYERRSGWLFLRDRRDRAALCLTAVPRGKPLALRCDRKIAVFVTEVTSPEGRLARVVRFDLETHEARILEVRPSSPLRWLAVENGGLLWIGTEGIEAFSLRDGSRVHALDRRSPLVAEFESGWLRTRYFQNEEREPYRVGFDGMRVEAHRVLARPLVAGEALFDRDGEAWIHSATDRLAGPCADDGASRVHKMPRGGILRDATPDGEWLWIVERADRAVRSRSRETASAMRIGSSSSPEVSCVVRLRPRSFARTGRSRQSVPWRTDSSSSRPMVKGDTERSRRVVEEFD